jgi:quercetin dioxygenase-like cupin family protein
VAHSLRLIEHYLEPGGELSLPAAVRALFAATGEASATSAGDARPLDADHAWHGTASCVVTTAAGARLLRFELVRQPPPPVGEGRALLEHPLALSGEDAWLIRCDRVDFAPGGVALPHRHRGGGIRRLLRGSLTVTVGDGPPRVMRPGDPWFESGREPVLASAAPDDDTSFVRVSILPAEIQGRTSILYVDPADATRSRPRTYTVCIDEPLKTLP